MPNTLVGLRVMYKLISNVTLLTTGMETKCLRYFTVISSIFICPTSAQLVCSKRMLKFTLIFTLKVLLHVSV